MNSKLVLSRSAWRAVRAVLRNSSQPVSLGMRASYAWSSALFSTANYFEVRALALDPQLQPPRLDPLFLLGFWRSGTTLLHELVSAEPTLRSPTTVECMNPLNILRPTPAAAGAREIVRPMDNVRISSQSPQEDEFALLALGAESIYRAFIAPDLLASGAHELALHTRGNAAVAEWTRVFRDLLSRLERIDQRRLLLKSPTHSFRVRVLAPLMPGSQFLQVVREPRDTWCSNVRMWRAMTQRYALSPLNGGALAGFLRVALGAFSDEIEWMRANLPSHRYQEVRYEALASNPVSELARVNSSLQIVDAALRDDLVRTRWLSLPKPPNQTCDHADCGLQSAATELNRLAALTGYEPVRT